MKTLILAALLFSTSAFADPWRTEDTYREAAFQVLNLIDWGQTRYIANNPLRCTITSVPFVPVTRGFPEFNLSNPTGQTFIQTCNSGFREIESAWAIGEHPSVETVDTFMALSAVLHLAVSYLLPPDWRGAFQYITIGQKLNATIGNASIGVKVSFN